MNYTNLWNNFYNIFIKNLFGFKGRARRREYIIRTLTMAVLLYCWQQVKDDYNNSSSIFIIYLGVVYVIIGIIYIMQFFFLLVRRLHDLNLRGWWIIVFIFVPFCILTMAIINQNITNNIALCLPIIFLLYTACKKGNSSANKYGEPPEY